MAELKVGLAPNRTSYFDQVTNTYMTLQAPVQSITYDESDMPGTVKRLEKIVHALFASVPALVLYEGKVPQECIDAWKDKYMKPFNTDMAKLVRDLSGNIVPPAVKPNRAFDRPEQVNDQSVDNEVIPAAAMEAEEVEIKTLVEEPKEEPALEVKEEVAEEVKEEIKEEVKKEAPKKTRKSTGTKADK